MHIMMLWQSNPQEVMWNRWDGDKTVSCPHCNRIGTDMVIANGKDVGIIHQIISGTFRGTLFRAQNDETFDIHAYLQNR